MNNPRPLNQDTVFMCKRRLTSDSIQQNKECGVSKGSISKVCATLGSPNFFLRVDVLSDWPMRCGLWLFLVLAANLSGNPGCAVELSAADDADRSKDASPISESPSEQINSARTPPSWRLVRSAGTNAEPGASAILHTMDFERSDPRLAGLMLQCRRQGIEIIIVVVEPFPPHARPQITLRTPGQESRFVGTIIPTGAGIRLPSDATRLAAGPWQSARELEIKVADGASVIDGVVSLSGLSEALSSLDADCVQK
jgi:hypothetical protein